MEINGLCGCLTYLFNTPQSIMGSSLDPCAGHRICLPKTKSQIFLQQNGFIQEQQGTAFWNMCNHVGHAQVH